MSQMPDSIYLHKDSKYNTSGEYFAQDENRILYENEYDESVMEDYVEYTPIYRLEEAVRKSEKDLGWHSVEESLPPVDEEVIVLADRLNLGSLFAIAIGHIVKQETYKIKIDSEIKEFTSQNHNGWNIPGVKFWMPLPKIPEE